MNQRILRRLTIFLKNQMQEDSRIKGGHGAHSSTRSGAWGRRKRAYDHQWQKNTGNYHKMKDTQTLRQPRNFRGGEEEKLTQKEVLHMGKFQGLVLNAAPLEGQLRFLGARLIARQAIVLDKE